MKCWVITEFAFTLYVDTADFGLIGPLLNGRLSEIIGIVVFIMTVISSAFFKKLGERMFFDYSGAFLE